MKSQIHAHKKNNFKIVSKNLKLAQFALNAKALKTVKGGNETPVIQTNPVVQPSAIQLAQDFNTKRGNREKQNPN